jgi:hypothetical protein
VLTTDGAAETAADPIPLARAEPADEPALDESSEDAA